MLYDKGTEKPFGFGSGACVGSGVGAWVGSGVAACVGSGVGAWVGSGVGAWVGFGNEIFFSKMTSKHSINSLFFHK